MKRLLQLVLVVLIVVLVGGVAFYERPVWFLTQQTHLGLFLARVQSNYVLTPEGRVHYYEAEPRIPGGGVPLVLVHGLAEAPLRGVANLGVRPSLDPNDVNGGRVLLETHCLDWPDALGAEGAYGQIIRVELLHKLHDELKYDGLDALTQGIRRDCDDARAWLARRI